jgi:DNA topoisomerase IB
VLNYRQRRRGSPPFIQDFRAFAGTSKSVASALTTDNLSIVSVFSGSVEPSQSVITRTSAALLTTISSDARRCYSTISRNLSKEISNL